MGCWLGQRGKSFSRWSGVPFELCLSSWHYSAGQRLVSLWRIEVELKSEVTVSRGWSHHIFTDLFKISHLADNQMAVLKDDPVSSFLGISYSGFGFLSLTLTERDSFACVGFLLFICEFKETIERMSSWNRMKIKGTNWDESLKIVFRSNGGREMNSWPKEPTTSKLIACTSFSGLMVLKIISLRR